MTVVQIQMRRDSAADWTSANPTLAQGEIGFETDTGKFKIGDGSTAWTSLSYFVAGTFALANAALLTGGKSGVYYGPTATAVTSANALPLNRLYCMPLHLAQDTTLDRIGVEVDVAAGSSTIRLGVYDDDGNGYPGARLLDAGTVDSTSTGLKQITISLAVPAGLVWVGAVAQGGTPSIHRLSGRALPVGLHSFVGGATVYNAWLQDSVSGALPASFTTTKEGSSDGRNVLVRVA